MLQSAQLSTALSCHIGPLSLGLSYITYLARYPPRLVQDILINALQPCVAGIGFNFSDDPVFTGLLNQLCPVPSYVCHPELMSLMSTQSYLFSDSFQGNVDSVSDQTNHLNNSLDISKRPRGSSTNDASVYYSLCCEMINSIVNKDRCDELRLATGEGVAHSLCMNIVNRSWNMWPLISDPENSLRLGEDWTILSGREWLVLDTAKFCKSTCTCMHVAECRYMYTIATMYMCRDR